MNGIDIGVGIVWFSPILASVVLLLDFGRSSEKKVALWSITAALISFLSATVLQVLYHMQNRLHIDGVWYRWLDLFGGVNVGYHLDGLAVQMVWMVSFILLLVLSYSIGYMHRDKGFSRFFALVLLFGGLMHTLVLSSNLVIMFMGWEGVGLASYLLIGYYFKKQQASEGALKAFITNRFGDMGLVLAMGIAWWIFASLDHQEIITKTITWYRSNLWQQDFLYEHTSWMVFGLLLAACAKSAQLPLHIWLPASMVGPTPISALIHAATMVTAGVFLVGRYSVLFSLYPSALMILQCLGATGALGFALVAVCTYDIKKIVAYSTLSQLGYMICACGLKLYALACFHLLTHAYFKALLFLCVGSIQKLTSGELDIRKIQGIGGRCRVTAVSMCIGVLSLSGFAPFAGFYSKEAILYALEVLITNDRLTTYVYGCLLSAAWVGVWYGFRMLWLIVTPDPQSSLSGYGDGQEKGIAVSMKVSLVILSVCSVIGGYVMFPWLLSGELFKGALGEVDGLWVRQVMFFYQKINDPWHFLRHGLTHWITTVSLFVVLVTYYVYGVKRKVDFMSSHWVKAWVAQFGFDAVLAEKWPRVLRKMTGVLEALEIKGYDRFWSIDIRLWYDEVGKRAQKLQSGILTSYVLQMMIATIVMVGLMIWQVSG